LVLSENRGPGVAEFAGADPGSTENAQDSGGIAALVASGREREQRGEGCEQ
jgi:hypothetical protein